MARERIPIPFDAGLDRDSGRMVVRPGAMRDLRNVYLSHGRVSPRRGLQRVATLTDEGGNPVLLIAGQAQRTERVVILIGYQDTGNFAGRVYAYRWAPDSDLPPEILPATPTRKYLWWVNTEFGGVPRVSLADSRGLIFIAHDERLFRRRGETFYYDPMQDNPIQPLMSDFGRGYEEPARFRGVARHLAYLVGWGHDAENAHYLRVSEPGNPTSFTPHDYWIVGHKGESIVGVRDGIVFKAHEVWELTGYDRKSFGSRMIDARYGAVSGALTMEWEGGAVFWSAEGPRHISKGSASVDLALPLDLLGYQPADLTEASAARDGFVCYLPARRVIMFVFGKRVFSLSLKTPNDPRWSYFELGVEARCGFNVSTAVAGAGSGSGPGGPDDPPVVPDEWAGYVALTTDHLWDFAAMVLAEPRGVTGEEQVEVWIQPWDGTWQYLYRTPIRPQNAGSMTLRVGYDPARPAMAPLAPGTAYTVAARLQLGGRYAPGFTGATPDNWSWLEPAVAASRTSFTTTSSGWLLGDPLWLRVSAEQERISFNVTGVFVEGALLEILRREAGTTEWTSRDVVPIANIVNYVDFLDEGDGEKTWEYSVRSRAGEEEPYEYGPSSNVVSAYAGPPAPRGRGPGTDPYFAHNYGPNLPPHVEFHHYFDYFDQWNPEVRSETSDEAHVYCVLGIQETPDMELEYHLDFRWSPGAYTDTFTIPLAEHLSRNPERIKTLVPRKDNTVSAGCDVRVRTKWTQYGVTDYSPWTPTFVEPEGTTR